MRGNAGDYDQAKATFDAGDVTNAIRQFEALMSMDTNMKKHAAFALGHIYERRGPQQDYQKALDYYAQAEVLGIVTAIQRQGAVYRRLGLLEEALAKYKDAARTIPSAAFWTYDILSKSEKLQIDDGEAERYLELAAQRGSIFAKRVKALRKIKGREGVGEIPNGFIMFAKLLVETCRVAVRGEAAELM